MKIADVQVFAYSLPLKSPLQTAGRVMDRRDGWLVRVRTAQGAEGWGDCAPLPGFSREEPAEARQQLLLARSRLMGLDIETAAPHQGRVAALESFSSSVRFGVESALVVAGAKEIGETPSTFLGANAESNCTLNALAFGPLSDCVTRAQAAAQAGYTALKLKVGRTSPAQDAERIRRVAEILPGTVALRLDANRAWSLDAALEVARRINGVKIAYVEEPLADASQLTALHESTGWPLALDESIHGCDPASPLPSVAGVVAWVIKPTLVGGLVSALQWQDRAVSAGVQPVLSSSFENGVGIRMLADLAARHPHIAVGLDTYRNLADDLLEPRLNMETGRIDLKVAHGSVVKTSRLVPLS